MPTPPRRWPQYYTVVLLCFAAVFISYLDRTNISVASIAMQDEFKWSETTKGFVLSSFFIGYLLLQVVSGTLANRFGGWIVLGVAVVWWSLFTLLTPPAAMMSLSALVGARIALGLGEAAVFPSAINMVGRWVPPAQRSRAVSLFISGLSIGTVVALPATGGLVRAYGWPMPFYVFGALGFVWAYLWFRRLNGGRGEEAQIPASATRAIPWRRIWSTPAVWAIIINHFCHNWALYLLLAWLPSYFKSTYQVTLANAGVLSAAPWLTNFLMANLGGLVADRMMRAGRSATFVRKLLQCTGLIGCGSFLLLLQQATTVGAAVLLMCGAAGLLGLCISGYGPNAFDIAPHYADVIWGISNTAGTIPGIVGVAVTGWLVQGTGSYSTPFIVTAGIGAFGALVYLTLGSGDRKIE